MVEQGSFETLQEEPEVQPDTRDEVVKHRISTLQSDNLDPLDQSIFQNSQQFTPNYSKYDLKASIDKLSIQKQQPVGTSLPFIFVPITKRKDLTPLENLIILPANHMSRYKNLQIGEEIRTKILGKLKAHTIESFVQAGHQTYPEVPGERQSPKNVLSEHS